MLVLAEEIRLYITGTHQYPNNVSSLFFSESVGTSTVSDQPQRPPSSEGSFVSAQSEAVPIDRPKSEASSVTDEDTETLQTCTTDAKNPTRLTRNRSTSDEDITLKEDDNKMAATDISSTLKTETILQPALETDAKTLREIQQPPALDPASSLPDPQSTHSNTVTLESQHPSSNETITLAATPTITPEINSSSKLDELNPVTTPTTATSDIINDNPEEHVYEEIDVIRAQVQSIRASSVPTDLAPPPLPPKKKIISGGEDESGMSVTYPHMEWFSASTPASLHGGSTGARRKKRRAPMPPEFMSQNWKESQETLKKENDEVGVKIQECEEPDAMKKVEYRRSLNPFYEELDLDLEDTVKETESKNNVVHEDTTDKNTVNNNPFLENKLKASGYIGKNPFYDDVEILKKSEEYKELKTNQSKGVLTSATDAILEHPNTPVVRPKRRAPHPPPTPETHDLRTEEPASSQEEDRLMVTSVLQAAGGSDSTNNTCKQTLQKSSDQSNIETPLPASTNTKMEPKLERNPNLNTDTNINTVEKNLLVPQLPEEHQQDRITEAARLTTPKITRSNRTSPSHPKAPPPPPPKSSPSTPSIENSVKIMKDDSLLPIPPPPPKAPLSLLDEIPYMDANEIKEARAQRQSPEPHLQVASSGSPAGTLKLNTTSPQHLHVHDADLPPQCPPPLPPSSPPESPPETPHTSPPDTPHNSPPETPHTSPPVTPNPSPPTTPSLSLNHSPLRPSRHKSQDSLISPEKGCVLDKGDVIRRSQDEAPPVPPKTFQLETPSPLLPPKASHHQERTPQPHRAVHFPVTGTPSVPSSTVEERYEIPDTSRAPPPRPPVPAPPKMQPQQKQQQNEKTAASPPEYDRYEVPEAPKHPVTAILKQRIEVVKTTEAEERYEIPEVVKEQLVKRGVNGAVSTRG